MLPPLHLPPVTREWLPCHQGDCPLKQPCHVRLLIPALHLLARTTAKAYVWFQERESSRVHRFSNSQPVLRTRPLPGPPTPAAGASVTQSQLRPHSLWPKGFQWVPSDFRVQVDSHPPGTRSPHLAQLHPPPSLTCPMPPLCQTKFGAVFPPVCAPKHEAPPLPYRLELYPLSSFSLMPPPP